MGYRQTSQNVERNPPSPDSQLSNVFLRKRDVLPGIKGRVSEGRRHLIHSQMATPVTPPFWPIGLMCQTLKTDRAGGGDLIPRITLPERRGKVYLRMTDRQGSLVCSPRALQCLTALISSSPCPRVPACAWVCLCVYVRYKN